jgi:diguanylate cyclase (GGDEF)-like protein
MNDDANGSRLLDALTRVMNRPLTLSADAKESAMTVVSRTGSGPLRVAIRDGGEQPLNPDEREALHELADLFAGFHQARSESEILEQRVRLLERENAELSSKNRALAEISARDPLTGLYTRLYILDKIEAEMNRSLRHGKPLSVLMLDLDHFKQINETFGHPIGDQVLQSVGNVLRDSCRIYDMASRFGGEEFCLMLPETRVHETLIVAERMRQRLEHLPIVCGHVTLHITASVGVAGLESVPEEGLFSAMSLVERADRALYTAKDRGRNRVEIWNTALNPGAARQPALR